MSSLLHGAALLRRSPRTTHRHALAGIVAAWSRRRRKVAPAGPHVRRAADSGVSPLVSGASRGVTLFIGR